MKGSEGQAAISSLTSEDFSDSKFISQVVSSVSMVNGFYCDVDDWISFIKTNKVIVKKGGKEDMFWSLQIIKS